MHDAGQRLPRISHWNEISTVFGVSARTLQQTARMSWSMKRFFTISDQALDQIIVLIKKNFQFLVKSCLQNC